MYLTILDKVMLDIPVIQVLAVTGIVYLLYKLIKKLVSK